MRVTRMERERTGTTGPKATAGKRVRITGWPQRANKLSLQAQSLIRPTRSPTFMPEDPPLFVSVVLAPARPQERRTHQATVPRRHAQPRLPLMCCNRTDLTRRRPTSLIRGIRGRAGCGNQTYGARPSRTSPRAALNATPRTSRDDHATLEPRSSGRNHQRAVPYMSEGWYRILLE